MTQSPDESQQDQAPDGSPDERVESRAEQLPEEKRAGGADDPEAQAEAILEESDERTADPEGTRRESTQIPDDPPSQADLADDVD